MKIYQYTCIHRKYISIHVLRLLNIQISFNILFTSQNCLLAFFYKPVTINFLWLYLHHPSMVPNHYTLLPQKTSHHSFLFFISSLSFTHFLSCARQTIMPFSDISLHLHNLGKFIFYTGSK